MLSAALGFRVHSGWACLVAVAGPDEALEVIERRRLELVDHKIRGAEQPYHAAREMQLTEAAAFLERCAATAQTTAASSLRNVISDLTNQGYVLAGACLLLGSGRPTADLAATLRSHPMVHTAEGHFFRDALQKACESRGLPVLRVKEKELASRAAATIRLLPEELEQRISALGKLIGPPWRQDEKLCTLAAWLALANGSGRASGFRIRRRLATLPSSGRPVS